MTAKMKQPTLEHSAARVRLARMDMSIEMTSRKYLHKWVGSERYPRAKEQSDEIIARSREILHQSDGETIWYYKKLPTMGNKFRGSIASVRKSD